MYGSEYNTGLSNSPFFCSNPLLINGTTDAARTISYLNYFEVLITRYVGTTFYTFGLIGALLNIHVFSQSPLRSNPCCLFLLSLNIVDFLHIHNSLLVRIAQHGFHWDPTVVFPFLCRIRYYIGYVLITLYVILITLASCERYASTCKRRSRWRRFSKSSSVCYVILGCTLICCFICLFACFCYGINKTALCTVQEGVCKTLTIVYTLIAIGLVPPIFTAVFAWLTLRNLRLLRRRSRIAPVSYKTYLRIKQTNEQLTSMIFMQVAAMLVSSLPYASLMVYQLSTRHLNKMPMRIAWEQLITHSIHLLVYVNYVSSAYIYLATSPMYRKHLVPRGTQLGLGAEIQSSVLLSLSLAEKTRLVFSEPERSFEVTGQQQKHHPRFVWVRIISTQGESCGTDRDEIFALQADSV